MDPGKETLVYSLHTLDPKQFTCSKHSSLTQQLHKLINVIGKHYRVTGFYYLLNVLNNVHVKPKGYEEQKT